MSYEQAPATKLLAAHCLFCNRPLLDAASVEAGIGPVCREKVGYNDPVPDHARLTANKLIHQIATNRGSTQIREWLEEIRSLGLERLVEKLEEALTGVKITEVNGRLFIETPYSPASLNDWRRIPGRAFDWDTKRNHVPSTQKAAVFALLKKHYPGTQALGPKGLFTL